MLGFILLVIIAIPVGLILAFVIVISQERKRLKKINQEIDQKINAFESRTFSTPEEKEKEKYLLKKELIKLKAKIFDIKLRAEVGDKINIL